MTQGSARWAAVCFSLLGVLLAGCGGSGTARQQADATATATQQTTPTSAPGASATIYFGGVTTSASKAPVATMYALNAATGALRWSKPLGVKNGLFVTAAGADVYATDMLGAITTLNAATGSQLWQAKGHSATDGQPVADGAALYLGSSGDSSNHGYVDAYSATDGKRLWERDLGVLQTPSLTIAQGILYVSTQNTLTAVRTADGSTLWTTSVPWAAPAPYLIGGAVYLNYMGEVRVYSAADGKLKWHYTPPTRSPMGDTSVSGAAGLVFAGDGATLTALHAADGSVAWSAPLSKLFYGTSAYDGVVYAAPGVLLVARDAQTGKQVWSVTLSGIDGAPPILSNGILFESRFDGAGEHPSGYVYALSPTDGSVFWNFTHPGEAYTSVFVM